MLHRCRAESAAPRPGRRARRFLPAGLLALAVAGTHPTAWPANPQDQAADRSPPLNEVERVRLVVLPATVSDSDGRPVRGLGADDFRLHDGGVPQPIGFLETEEDSPIALAFLLDISGSMKLGDRLGQAKGAIRFFSDALGPDDRMGLICFAGGVVEWVSAFGVDRKRFAEALAAQIPRGRTALYDALAASPDLVDRDIRGRKAIILITDGLDNASDSTTLRAIWLARRVNVPIYTLNFIPMREKLLSRRALAAIETLQRFSDETGGALYKVHRSPDLARAVEAIQAELRFQYNIGFYPSQDHWDGSFRPVELKTRDSRLKVRTRSGYYAGP